MSDEPHFHFSGYMNEKNYRSWGTENPRAITPAQSDCMVRCSRCWRSQRAIFFENTAGQTATVDHSAMLTEFFLPQLDKLGLEDRHQQDGATSPRSSHLSFWWFALARKITRFNRSRRFFWVFWSPMFTWISLRPWKPSRQHSTRVRNSVARSSRRSDETCHKTSPYGNQLWRRPFGRYHLLDLTNKDLKVQINIIKTQNRNFSFRKKIRAKQHWMTSFGPPCIHLHQVGLEADPNIDRKRLGRWWTDCRTSRFGSAALMRTAKEWNGLPASVFSNQYN